MWRTDLIVLVVLGVYGAQGFAAPADTTHSLIASSTEPTSDKSAREEGNSADVTGVPKIYQMHVQSDVRNRFAHTKVISKVKNLADKAQQATFSVVLPESAFISGFIMEVGGKNYTAHVKEKEEAKRAYDEAVAGGLGAAHVTVSARDSNRFTVSVNVEPESKAAFYLTYEQLLERRDGHYEQVINLHPGQPVADLSVEVVIAESRKIINLRAPPLRSGNEIGNEKAELDPRADLKTINDSSAIVTFSPNLERQKQLAHLLNTKEEEGLAAQFVVQYDVERDPQGGEVLIQDGYFVHFFAPTELKPLPKYVVFVLDTSGSMRGHKIQQLKEAMQKILEQLNEQDFFSLVEFNSFAKVWNLDNSDASAQYFDSEQTEGGANFNNVPYPNAYNANEDNIKKAKSTVSQLHAGGGTSMYDGLKVGLHLVELASDTINHQPIIIFLTDGHPALYSTHEIINKISESNSGPRKSAIFTLSFGYGADKDFLKALALRNSGFSKHIYEAADAALQLQDFYRQISSPLLSNVTFKYEPSVTSLTSTEFPIHFGGSEIVVAGVSTAYSFSLAVVDGWSTQGHISLKPTIEQTASNIERLWAYLTVKQLLQKKEASDKDKEDLKEKALEIALKYSFVTPVSSLIVVKPNDTSTVNAETAEILKTANEPLMASSLHTSRKRVMEYRPIFQPQFLPETVVSAAQTKDLLSVQHRPVFQQQFLPETVVSAAQTKDLLSVQHRPVFQQQYLPETAVSVAQTPDLLSVLPWLKNILDANGVLSLPTGNYKLGLNETTSDTVECAKTPLDTPGHCTFLHECPEVYPHLTGSDVFVQHLCVLKSEYAGVCCPNKS